VSGATQMKFEVDKLLAQEETMKAIKKPYRISFSMMLFLAAFVFLFWPGQLLTPKDSECRN